MKIKNKGAFQVEYALVAIVIIMITINMIKTYYPVLSNSTNKLTQDHTQQKYPTYTIDKMDGTSITNR